MPTVNDAARITARQSAVWRTCATCGLLLPLPPDADICPVCTDQPTVLDRYAVALGRIDAWANAIPNASDAERLEHIRSAVAMVLGKRA
jgi:hypothetical protein